jgi:hypothetical protein
MNQDEYKQFVKKGLNWYVDNLDISNGKERRNIWNNLESDESKYCHSFLPLYGFMKFVQLDFQGLPLILFSDIGTSHDKIISNFSRNYRLNRDVKFRNLSKILGAGFVSAETSMSGYSDKDFQMNEKKEIIANLVGYSDSMNLSPNREHMQRANELYKGLIEFRLN